MPLARALELGETTASFGEVNIFGCSIVPRNLQEAVEI